MAVAVAISATTVAQSKRNQSRIKQPPAQVTKSESGKEQPQPQQPPIIVNIVPAPKTDAERAEEAEERRNKSETDAKLAEYTRELALFTKGLFYATTVLGIATIGLLIAAFIQSREMKNSIAVSDKIAEAAIKSANVAEQALLMAETPYLVPEITDCRVRTSADSIYEIDLGNTVTFHINNYGRTPATIYDIYSCLFPAYALPDQIDTTSLHTNLTKTDIIPAHKRSTDYYFSLNDGLRDSLFRGKKDANRYIIFFIGHIRFGDVFGNEYISGFCLARNGATGEFYGLGGSQYNYRRKIKSSGE
jgi:hypothetical protein